MAKIFFNIFILVFLLSCQSSHGTLRNKFFAKSGNNASVSNTKEKITKPIQIEAKRTELNSFLDDWIGVPYKFGGVDKTGIDCSAFSSQFYKDILNIDILRTTELQFDQGKPVKESFLQLGDLVFFNITGGRNSVDHVGVYLSNGNFVHASTSSGVTISNLNEHYFKERYIGSRRIAN